MYQNKNQCIQHNGQAIFLDKTIKEYKRQVYCQKCVENIKNYKNLLIIKDVETLIQKHQQQIIREKKITNHQNLEVLLNLKEQLFQFQSKLSQYTEQSIQIINEYIQTINSSEHSLEQKVEEMLQKFVYENIDIDEELGELIDYKSIKKSISYSLSSLINLSFVDEHQQFLKKMNLQQDRNQIQQIKDFFKNQQEIYLIRNQVCENHKHQIEYILINQQNQYDLGCLKCDENYIVQKRRIEEIKERWDQYKIHTEKYIGLHQKANSSLQLLHKHKIAFIQLINQFNQLFEPNEDKIDEIQRKTFHIMQKDWHDMTNEDALLIAKLLNDQNNHLIIDDTIKAEIEANQIQIRQFCQNQIQINDQIKNSFQIFNTPNTICNNNNSKEIITSKCYELINSFKDNECKAIAFSSDSTIMIAGYCNCLINVYEFKLGFIKIIQELKQHRNMVTCLNFMKKSTSFISGSKDLTIIIWMMKDKNKWQVQQKLDAHSDWIVCLICNNNDNLIISGSDDKSIKFWIKSNNWNHSQTLLFHTGRIRSLSLNESQNLLISCAAQDDRILIYNCENNNSWVLSQVIQQIGYRLCFLTDSIFSVQPIKTQEMQIYEFNQKNKLFYLSKSTFVKSGNGCDWLFPNQYIKSKQLLINKNGQNVNIIKLRDNGELITVQSIDFDTYFLYGSATHDGEYLLTWNAKTQEMQVRKYKE